MSKTKRVYEVEGTDYETQTYFEMGHAVVDVYKIAYPHRRFFRKKYIGSKSFWVEDYPTISDGIEYVLLVKIKQQKEKEEKYNKIQKFLAGGR